MQDIELLNCMITIMLKQKHILVSFKVLSSGLYALLIISYAKINVKSLK